MRRAPTCQGDPMTPLVCPHCHAACAPPPGYAGQPLVCPTCSKLMLPAAPVALVVSASPAAQEVPLAGPLAPPVEYANEATQEFPAASSPSEYTSQRTRAGSRQLSCLLLLLLMTACGMFLLAATAVAYAIVARARGHSIVSPLDPESPLWSSDGFGWSEPQWTPAQDNILRVGPASVKVVRVEIGEARGKDTAGNVVISEGNFLHIVLRIKNDTPLPLEYRSWYGNDFSDAAKRNPLRVQLTDDAQRPYGWVLFDDVERVRWHTPSETIAPRRSVEDVIIFQLPPGVTKQGIQFLRLTLPAAAVGYRAGYYRFEIPRAMIEGIR